MPRFAVLPFEVIGGGEMASELALTIADAVSGSLTEHFVQTVSAARSSEFATSARRSILSDLGVNLVMSGSVRMSGNHYYARAYYEDLDSQFTVWSSQFESRRGDELALATEIAVLVTELAYDVADALKQPDAGLDAQVLSAVLKLARAVKDTGSETPERIAVMAEQVIALAPNYAEGHGLLALMLSESPDKSVRTRARREAEAAIGLYPAAGPAHDAMYQLTTIEAPTDLVLAERVLLSGLAAAPRFPFLQMRRCIFLMNVGRVREALHHCRQAAALRPLAPPVAFRLVRALITAGEASAGAEFGRAALNHPQSHWVNTMRFDQFVQAGRLAEAMSLLEDPATRPAWVSTDALPSCRAALVALGTRSPADVNAATEQLVAATHGGTLDAVYAARFASLLGKVDEALALLSRLDANPFAADSFVFDPSFGALHRDPRFMALMVTHGHVAYWRVTGVWPDFCADPTWPYRCDVAAGGLTRTPSPAPPASHSPG
jgi:TolB-like protein